MSKNNIKIAILIGGASTERPVSKQSGKAIYEAVNNLGYSVKLIDPAYGLNQPHNIPDYFSDCEYSSISKSNYLKTFNSNLFDEVDLVIIALHGKWGEDGTIQSLLELKNIKYTGSGILGSSLSMDKAKSKAMFIHSNVLTPKWLEINKNISLTKLDNKIISQIKYPCIVKPNDQGSTIGLTKCNSKIDLEEALNLGFQFSNSLLVEEFIDGREITVGILNNLTLPVLEIIPQKELYDYECKYSDGMSNYIVPAVISKELERDLRIQAKLAFDSLGCSNYARVDFRIDKNNKPFCLEVNSLPGMTSHSLLPKMAEAQGINFEKLIEMIINSAL